MTTTVKTQQQFYQIYKDEVQAVAPEFTDFSEGSIHDIIAGSISMLSNELAELIVSNFSKTFFDLAEGTDLDTLVVDHFGSTFARLDASEATGSVTFSRPTSAAGDVTIPAGTVVKTVKNAQGTEIRFVTTSEQELTGLSKVVSVIAAIAGTSGNVNANKVTVIESALTDATITVTNGQAMSGGIEAQTDAEYREFAKLKLLSLAGATEAAVRGAILTVPGIEFCQLVTEQRVVIEYDLNTLEPAVGETFFRIPYPVAYISDENGNSSQALIDAAKAAIEPVRACGVKIDVRGASPQTVNWTATLSLNLSGPNYATLSEDLSMIKDAMSDYINTTLAIGDDFIRATANAHILAIFGPAGTDDITAFSTSVPASDVSVASNEKTIAGTMTIV
jgi:hypothetical protein